MSPSLAQKAAVERRTNEQLRLLPNDLPPRAPVVQGAPAAGVQPLYWHEPFYEQEPDDEEVGTTMAVASMCAGRDLGHNELALAAGALKEGVVIIHWQDQPDWANRFLSHLQSEDLTAQPRLPLQGVDPEWTAQTKELVDVLNSNAAHGARRWMGTSVAKGRATVLWRPERVAEVKLLESVPIGPYGHKTLEAIEVHPNKEHSPYNRNSKGPLVLGVLCGGMDGTSFPASNEHSWGTEAYAEFRAGAPQLID